MSKQILYSTLLATALLLGFQNVQGEDLDKLRSQYPDADAVYVNLSNHYTVTNNNGNLQVSDQVEEVIAYLTSKGIGNASDAIYYSSFSDIKDIDAYTESPTGKGNRYKNMKVDNFTTKNALSGGVFYDDRKKIEFTFPGVVDGAVTHLRYTEVYKDPRMLDGFYFTGYMPLHNAELKVTFPESVKIAYTMIGEDTSLIKFTSEKAGKNITYTWSASNVPSSRYEENAPSRSYYYAQVIIRISSYEDNNGKQVALLGQPKDLYNWYRTLVKDINKTDETSLKAIAEGLVKGKTTDDEKAKAIYQWVQNNINYVAFEDGMGGFIPRNAADVYSKKYGDCKDMANLLREMLGFAGLDASLTWIGTRHLPYTYEAVPTPIVDNHMITALHLQGKTIFMDATGKYIPFGLPSPMIQGKEALVGIDSSNFKIITVPPVDKDINSKFDSTTVSIENRDLKGTGHMHLAGFQKLSFDYAYYGGQFKDQKTFYGIYLNKGSNKFNLNDADVTGLTDPDKETDLSYDYTIPDYIKSSNNKIYVNLNLNKPLKDDQIDLDKRKHAREFEYKYVEHYKVVLNLPEGYSVEYLPQASAFDGADYGFSTSYSKSDNQITFDKKVYVNTLMLDKPQFKDWDTYLDKLNKAYKETVVLTKIMP